MLRLQKGALDEYMQIVWLRREAESGGKIILMSCAASMETKVVFVATHTPPGSRPSLPAISSRHCPPISSWLPAWNTNSV